MKKNSVTQFLSLNIEGEGLEMTSVDIKCIADAFSKANGKGMWVWPIVVVLCPAWEQEFSDHFIISQPRFLDGVGKKRHWP